jgi:hypothetical protein
MAKRSSGFYSTPQDAKFFDEMCDRTNIRGEWREIVREVFRKNDAGKATPGETMLMMMVINSPANNAPLKAKPKVGPKSKPSSKKAA